MDTDSINVYLASRGNNSREGEVRFANFNQDCTSLAMATKRGCCIYFLDTIDDVKPLYDNKGKDKEICLLVKYFSSSLVVFSTLKSPTKLKVCNFKKGIDICNYSYSNSILALKLNRLRLIVVLEECIYIHSIKDMKLLHTIEDTPNNHRGLCCLSLNNENSY